MPLAGSPPTPGGRSPLASVMPWNAPATHSSRKPRLSGFPYCLTTKSAREEIRRDAGGSAVAGRSAGYRRYPGITTPPA